MSSFFSKFRSSKPSKRKAAAANNGGTANNGLYGTSNNSSQASLAARSQASLQQGRGGFGGGFVPSTTPSTASLQTAPQAAGAPATAASSSSSSSQQQPLFLRQPFVRAALVKGSFQTIVELPKYVDQNEWVALNLFEFNTYVTQFTSMLSEYIDQNHVMSAGAGFDYLWIDTNRQAVKLPAATYIEYTLSWISSKFDDQSLFPTRQGVPFPPNFGSVAKSIYVQLFRIFAYIYHNHFDKIVHLSLEPHFNSLFCHFASFGKTFGLLERTEIAPLQPLIQNFESQGKIA